MERYYKSEMRTLTRRQYFRKLVRFYVGFFRTVGQHVWFVLTTLPGRQEEVLVECPEEESTFVEVQIQSSEFSIEEIQQAQGKK